MCLSPSFMGSYRNQMPGWGRWFPCDKEHLAFLANSKDHCCQATSLVSILVVQWGCTWAGTKILLFQAPPVFRWLLNVEDWLLCPKELVSWKLSLFVLSLFLWAAPFASSGLTTFLLGTVASFFPQKRFLHWPFPHSCLLFVSPKFQQLSEKPKWGVLSSWVVPRADSPENKEVFLPAGVTAGHHGVLQVSLSIWIAMVLSQTGESLEMICNSLVMIPRDDLSRLHSGDMGYGAGWDSSGPRAEEFCGFCIYGYRRANSHMRCKCSEESSLWLVLFLSWFQHTSCLLSNALKWLH